MTACETASERSRIGTGRPPEPVDQELRRFRRRVLQFALIPVLCSLPWLPIGLIFGQQFLERAKGPSTQTQIDQSFRNALARQYDLLFLGNSRIYRGINPDRFDLPAYNFGCNDDTFNHVYYKLKWLRKHGVQFRYLALGVDLFQFSYMSFYRNREYARYFGEDYLADYEHRPWRDLGLQLRKRIRALNPKYVFMPNNGRIFQRENGQYIKPGRARPTDTARRSTRRLPVQVAYFEKVLEDCRQHGVTVFLCMLPVRPEERNCYQPGEIEEFMDFIRGYTSDDVILLDYTYDERYGMSDYTDITHFNEAAAERFSVQLNEAIMARLSSGPDTSRIAGGSADDAVVR